MSASTSKGSDVNHRSHRPVSAVGRNRSIQNADDQNTLSSVRDRALITCPFSTEAWVIAMVRNRSMMPSVESRLMDWAVTELPYAAVITLFPGTT